MYVCPVNLLVKTVISNWIRMRPLTVISLLWQGYIAWFLNHFLFLLMLLPNQIADLQQALYKQKDIPEEVMRFTVPTLLYVTF